MTTKQTKGHLYLLRDPNLPCNVYKIGRTIDLKRRLSEYPNGSKYIRTFGMCVDCHQAESLLKTEFKHRFLLVKGFEYFRGSVKEMISTFESFCNEDPSPMLC